MKTLGHILCAIDLEKASERAFDRALSLAVIGEAKLFLLLATPENAPFSWRARERLEYFTQLRERAEAAGVRVRVSTTPFFTSQSVVGPAREISSRPEPCTTSACSLPRRASTSATSGTSRLSKTPTT